MASKNKIKGDQVKLFIYTVTGLNILNTSQLFRVWEEEIKYITNISLAGGFLGQVYLSSIYHWTALLYWLCLRSA